MKNVEKEIAKINDRIDNIMKYFEERESKCVPACGENIEYKTYEILRRMKFDNDIQKFEKRYLEVEEEIKKLSKEREYILAEKNKIEHKFYTGC